MAVLVPRLVFVAGGHVDGICDRQCRRVGEHPLVTGASVVIRSRYIKSYSCIPQTGENLFIIYLKDQLSIPRSIPVPHSGFHFF
jgi:hypothetical protein